MIDLDSLQSEVLSLIHNAEYDNPSLTIKDHTLKVSFELDNLIIFLDVYIDSIKYCDTKAIAYRELIHACSNQEDYLLVFIEKMVKNIVFRWRTMGKD